MTKTLSNFKEEVDNLIIIVENQNLFNSKVHCKMIEEFLTDSIKFLKELDDNYRKKIEKINKFHKDECTPKFFGGVVH